MSLDSGFSDCSEVGTQHSLSQSLEAGRLRPNKATPPSYGGEADGSAATVARRKREEEKRKLKSSVVHESHALNNSSKMHHVSKVRAEAEF